MDSCCCSYINDLNSLTNSYLNSCIPIIIEKDCGFNFITYQNEYATTLDLYRYVEQYYKHLDSGKVLYLNKEKDKLVFKNNSITLKKLFADNNILSITNLPERTVYKLYLSLI